MVDPPVRTQTGALTALAMQFAGLSLLAVGGANAVVPEIHRQAVDVAHWMNDREFADLFAIAQVSPGPNVIIVTLIGYRVAGVLGAAVATLAMCTPSCLAEPACNAVDRRYIRRIEWGLEMIFRTRSVTHSLAGSAMAAALVVVAMLGGALPAAAQGFAALAGSWSGGGIVSVSNGAGERIRCRAVYAVRERATSTEITLRCASDSYNFNLQANVHEHGGAVSGTWSEVTRNVSGSLSGHASGNQMVVRAEGPSFTANLLVHVRGDRQTVSIRASGGDITGVDVSMTRR
jgi:hypothetical protein